MHPPLLCMCSRPLAPDAFPPTAHVQPPSPQMHPPIQDDACAARVCASPHTGRQLLQRTYDGGLPELRVWGQ
jgi:hypothetical protein